MYEPVGLTHGVQGHCCQVSEGWQLRPSIGPWLSVWTVR